MSKVYEDVWIDGKKHTIVREKTAEERCAELDSRVAQVGRERIERAVRIAHENGHSFPTDSDFAEARRQMENETSEELLVAALMILGMVILLASCTKACALI
jgi:sugar/nucleoside kinase (ribokinase family)